MAQRAQPDLASIMYPSLSREAKAREAVAAQQRAEQKRCKAELLADLKALNRRIDERMQREASK